MNQFPDTVKAVLMFQEHAHSADCEEREVIARSPSELRGKITTMQIAGQRFVGFKFLNGMYVPPNPQGQHLANQWMTNWATYLNQRRGLIQQKPGQPQQPGQPQPVQQPDGGGFLPPPPVDEMTGAAVAPPPIAASIDPVTGLPIAATNEIKVLKEFVLDGKKIRTLSDGSVEAQEWVELSDEELNENYRIEQARDATSNKVIRNKYRVHQKKWVKKNG